MKMGFDRREFLAGGAGALSMSLLPKALRANLPAAVPPAPVARVDVVHDTYFGETLSDPYRWMENDKDPEWLPFLKEQNAHARAVLDALPGRASLLKRIGQLSGDTVTTSRVQRAGGLTFFAQRPKGADNFKLFVREGAVGRDRVLVDPTKAGGAGHVSLDWWRASPGRTACGLWPVQERQRRFNAACAHRRRRQRSSRTDRGYRRRQPELARRRQRLLLQPVDGRRRHPRALSRQPGAIPSPGGQIRARIRCS